MTILVLAALGLVPYSLIILYFRRCFKAIPVFHQAEPKGAEIPVSVILPARNEAQRIKACIDSLLAQDYPLSSLEIIVANDQSEDETAGIVSRYNHPSVRLVTVPAENRGGKKAALNLGIEASRGTLILTTDADCQFPVQWVRTLVDFYLAFDPVFIAAPVRIADNETSVGIFQSLDFLSLQGITAAAVHRQHLQMSNGANLAFRRDAFEAVDGYLGIDHIATGDDMLLMEKMARAFPGKTQYCLSPEAMVKTAPVPHWRAFFSQRIRWASKANQYRSRRMFSILLLVYLVNLILLLGALQILLHPSTALPWLGLMAWKTGVELWFLWPVATFFNQRRILFWFPLAQPFHLLYTVIAGFFGQVKQYQWKGRRIR